MENNSEEYIVKQRVTRAQLRKERERMAVPMGEPKKRHPIRNIVIFASTVTLIAGMAKGFELESRHFDISDGISLKTTANFSDFKLLWHKNYIGDVSLKLARNDYTDISESVIDDVVDFYERLEWTNYDNNTSFNDVLLSEYKYDVTVGSNLKYDRVKYDMLEKLESLYRACFYRPNKNNDNVELNKENAKKYLDFVLPLIIMNNGYYAQSPMTTVPRDLTTYNSNYPTTDQINAYGELPKFIQLICDLRAKEMLFHYVNYDFNYPHYLGERKDSSFVGARVSEILVNDIKQIKTLARNAQEETVNQGKK